MSKLDYVKYFDYLSERFYTTGTPDRLQGGISVIRYPAEYAIDALAYWYNECKKAGY